MSKLLSVCMITADSEDYVYESLSSVYDFADEIIIVDDNSQDNTLDILHSFPKNKLKIISKKFENNDYREVVKEKRNLCLELAKGSWLLMLDPDEIYQYKDLAWMCDTAQKTNKVHFRYNSIQYWKNFDQVITGPHWDDSQERMIKNLPGLRYDKHAFSVSVNGEVLARKYGKKFEDGIFWCRDDQIRIYHYGYTMPPEKMRWKLTNYMLADNPAVTPETVEKFVQAHPYFSGKLNQPRHGPNGLWVAGVDPGQQERVVPWKGGHPKVMQKKVEEFHLTGRMHWER